MRSSVCFVEGALLDCIVLVAVVVFISATAKSSCCCAVADKLVAGEMGLQVLRPNRFVTHAIEEDHANAGTSSRRLNNIKRVDECMILM